jgi:uncharacterized repeat protein (TIGR01451 family)
MTSRSNSKRTRPVASRPRGSRWQPSLQPHRRRLAAELLEDRRLLTLSTTDLTTGLTPVDLAQALVGQGISISHVKYTGNNTAAGLFHNGVSDGLGVDAGVILSSGRIANAVGPNDSDGVSASFNLPGDADLDGQITGSVTHDASVLEFDFEATGGTLSFQYVFGSDEYNEFVNSFNDVFAFFLNGVNVALIPGTSTPVSINNVNKGVNSAFYRNNDISDFGMPTPFPTQADGFTVVLQAAAAVSPGLNHIKLAIADAGDTALDSWVFLTGESFVSGQSDVEITQVDSPDPVPAGDMLTYTLVAKNNGPDRATAVLIQDELPANVTFVNATISSGSVFQAGGVISASPGPLVSGATATITITVIPTVPGIITNKAKVQAAQVDSTPQNNASSENTIVTRFKVSGVTAREGDSGMKDFVLAISQIAGHVDTAVITYGTIDGTATAGSDYVGQTGTLTFVPGETKKLITVQVFGDTTVELDETFFLGIVGDAVGANTIVNDDSGLIIHDVTVTEGSSTKNAVFAISVVGAVPVIPITVFYNTVDGTAKSASDYEVRSGHVTFAAGTMSGSISVPIVDDDFNEPTEFFEVHLSSATNAVILDDVGVATVLDNDKIPVLYVNDVQITSAGPTAGSAVFTVALDKPSGTTVTVQYATSDGTAQAGIDYTPQTGTLVFPAGVSSLQVSVSVATPAVYTPNKAFFLNLSVPTMATLGDAQGTATFVFSAPPVDNFIIDDGDAGYTQSGGWTNVTNLLAYQLDYSYHAAGSGSGSATWTFGSLPSGAYQVFTKWIPFSNRATNAPYTILDGATPLATVQVNQRLMPVGDQSNAVVWQSLGTFVTTTGILAVRLGDNANGYVVADAVRIVGGGIAPQTPEMNVSAFDHSIATDDDSPSPVDGTDFGSVASITSSTNHTFTITNNGNAPLHLGGSPRVAIGGTDPQAFSVVTQPAFTVDPGTSTTFTLMFHPTAVGVQSAVISIDNDDDTEQPYTFAVQGTGTAEGATELSIDDSDAGFHATSNWTTNANSVAVNGQIHAAAAGQGAERSDWTFRQLAPGLYQAYASWIPFGNRATNAPFSIADGATVESIVTVNQQQSPNDATFGGVPFESLGTFQVSSGTLAVSLTNQANGFVIADAVHIVRLDAPSPQAAVLSVAHNDAMPMDVNGDQRVSSMDALLVIGALLAPQPSASPLAATPLAAPSGGTGAISSYLDVNGDGRVSPLDALAVIRYLLAPQAPTASSLVATASAATAPEAVSGAASSPATVDQAIVEMVDPASDDGDQTALRSCEPTTPATVATQPGDSVANTAPLMTAPSLSTASARKCVEVPQIDSLSG